MLDRKTLLKNLAIGFLPLLVFIIADELFGLTIGLIIAIIFGIVETAFIYFKEKRIDKFILFDTGLIVVLGLISLLLQNDIFFKIKPGLIELILVGMLGVTAFTKNQLLINMTGRYMKGIEFSEAHITQMRLMMRRMFYVITLHTVLVFYSAYFMSKEAWGFISGGLLYIFLGGLMVAEWIRTKQTQKKQQAQYANEEWFDIVNPDGKVIGKAPRSVAHSNPDLLHQVVHVHIINDKGALFLQKRSAQKDLYPEFWDTAVGGHVDSGESISVAVKREAQEELGIMDAEFQPIFRYINRTAQESELAHVFLWQNNGPFQLNPEEISDGRFWSVSEIEHQKERGIFTANLLEEFKFLQAHVFPQLKNKSPQKKKKKKHK